MPAAASGRASGPTARGLCTTSNGTARSAGSSISSPPAPACPGATTQPRNGSSSTTWTLGPSASTPLTTSTRW
ncbi:hypothetical protein, partial [Pseudomonas aeruginosa]|uniref:hypothetical protein n=1 Tax=Pseudomonas aeruginosa TaxID=287 RepID=UPI0039E03804